MEQIVKLKSQNFDKHNNPRQIYKINFQNNAKSLICMNKTRIITIFAQKSFLIL